VKGRATVAKEIKETDLANFFDRRGNDIAVLAYRRFLPGGRPRFASIVDRFRVVHDDKVMVYFDNSHGTQPSHESVEPRHDGSHWIHRHDAVIPLLQLSQIGYFFQNCIIVNVQGGKPCHTPD